jgi:hypothetical protein
MATCQCGHSAEQHSEGRCTYELWDDGKWLVESCDCTAFQAPPGGNGNAPQRLSPPEPVSNHGRLSVTVWPVYLGLAKAQSAQMIREPTEHRDYERGQIDWFDLVKGVGRARVWIPKGIYTHIIFCMGPRENVIGVNQMEHPQIFDRSGAVDVDPINRYA